MKTKGVLVFARNNGNIDYCKQAYFLALRVSKYLHLPTTIVTDSKNFLLSEYPDAEKVFDKIISIVWKEEDIESDTLLSKNEHFSYKTFKDGALAEKKLQWKNINRSSSYDISPYDETLVLDTDVVICNDTYLKAFDSVNNFQIYKDSFELIDIDREGIFDRVSDTSVDFYWATVLFFRKTESNKVFFDLVKHIQDNWDHYKRVFQISSPYFRNDHAFSIAIHIMNGYQLGDFAKPLPGKLYHINDQSILWKIEEDSLLFLLEKIKHRGEYTPLRVKGCNVHVMNKFSLNRCIDEQ